METNNNIYSDVAGKIKENLPSVDTLQNLIEENKEVLSVAGGAFLAIVGLKFVSKTVGFLALVSGAALLYKGALSYTPVKEVLNKIAEPEKVEA